VEIVVAVEEAAGVATENGVVAQCRIAPEADDSATFHVGLVRMTLDEADWTLEKPCYYYLA
jgi:hypothetical protein